MMAPTAVVVGLHQNGLGVARALGRRGVEVVAVDQEKNDAFGATRYARRQSTNDLRGVGLIDTLCEVGGSLDSPGVLILTLDRSVLLVSEHRSRIDPYFVHSLPSDAVIQRLMNKSDTEEFAREHGFKMPRTYTVRSEEDLDRCISKLTLPCVLKPEVKTVAFVEHSPKKAFFIKSVDELRETWHRVAQWEPGVVVQEWIPGPETKLVFGLFYFDKDCRPVAYFGGRKIRQFIPHCGTACSAEPWEDERAYAEGVRFFQAAGYRGFGAIEFKIGPEGDYYLIEPTVGRTEHIFALAAANGINLPYAGYCNMAGLPVPPMRARRSTRIYVDWRRDYQAAQHLVAEGALTWGQWAKSIARPRQHAWFAWDDPGPILRQVGERVVRRSMRFRTKLERRAKRQIEVWRSAVNNPAAALGAAVEPRQQPGDHAEHINAAIDWLCAAQDAAGDGVARGYAFAVRSSYGIGWQAAYPETTGYIIPTFLDCANRLARPDLETRALRMARWELSVQLENGGFPGGTVDRRPTPVVFNTGMVLLGLTSAFERTGESDYACAIERAATFLLGAQARDGAWRRFVNWNGDPRIHAYDCLVNWGLVRAADLFEQPRWAEAAARNIEFTLTLQQPNGWFSHNALRAVRNATPLTHTIAYAAAGCLEAGVLLREPRFVEGARRTADALLEQLAPDGFLAGEFDRDWRPAATWSCLTGTAQMAIIWWRLAGITGDQRYAEAATRATTYVQLRHETKAGIGPTRGGVAGSFPVDSPYGRCQFLNWAAKFLIDALLIGAEQSWDQHVTRDVRLESKIVVSL